MMKLRDIIGVIMTQNRLNVKSSGGIMTITKKSVVEEVIGKYPATVDVFIRFGMLCFVCGEPAWGTVGENMERHKVKDPEKLLKALNETIKGTE
jgi:hybrid cluster-associated redox disulfide protein